METVSKKKVKLNRIQLLILYFFLFAFLGWVMETLYAIYNLGHFVKRGFLYGPICPIYGYGALILIIILSKYRKSSFKLFVYSIIIFTVFEYIVSFGLDALFGLKWWDYSERFLNLNGRISIFHSSAWGFIAILFINHIYPFVKKHVNIILAKIPHKIQIAIISVIGTVFIADTVLSCIRYII